MYQIICGDTPHPWIYTKAQQHKVSMLVLFWRTIFEASGFAWRKQLPANKLYSVPLHSCLASLLSPLFSPTTALPALIHLHSSTSNVNMALPFSSLLISVCYSVSFPLLLSLPLRASASLSAPLPNWYTISWSSGIAVTLSLRFIQAVYVVSPPYISFKRVLPSPSTPHVNNINNTWQRRGKITLGSSRTESWWWVTRWKVRKGKEGDKWGLVEEYLKWGNSKVERRKLT